MEAEEQIQILEHFLRGKQRRRTNDSASSDSEAETDTAGNSLNSSNTGTGSSTGTPRSSSSNDSSVLSSTRSNLLWDHGYDVDKKENEQTVERDSEWRQFSNKTDDDKLIADKCSQNKSKIKQTVSNNSIAASMQEPKAQASVSVDLPDLIPSSVSLREGDGTSSPEFEVDETVCTQPIEEIFTDYDLSEIPPPLPLTSPPDLDEPLDVKYSDSDDNCLDHNEANFLDSPSPCASDGGVNECVDNENIDNLGVNNTLKQESDGESSSVEGDVTSDDDVILERDGPDTKDDAVKSETQLETEKLLQRLLDTTYIPPEYADDMEAEFEYILKTLNMADQEVQNTYVERFAGRRDRYGFILSPIVEAPSPTPSSLSGYSGYSGISCASPDPFGVFRMSPAPNRGSRQDLDLSSLNVKSGDTDISSDQTVPIYQTVQAKKVIIVPEGMGWDSGDDLLSPRDLSSSGEWDKYDNGLSTPPVSTTYINFPQFGTRVHGWKAPGAPIYEESEQDESDTTEDEDNGSDKGDDDGSSTDTTVDEQNGSVHEDSDTTVGDDNESENESDSESESDNETDRSGKSVEQVKTGIDKPESSRNALDEFAVHVDRLLGNTLPGSFNGYNAEVADINSNVDTDKDEDETCIRNTNSVDSIPENTDLRGETDDDEKGSDSSDEDAGDEYSESDSESDQETQQANLALLGTLNMKAGHDGDSDNDLNVSRETDRVSVSEMLSPRTAILVSGGMLPEDSETTVFSSDDDTSRNVTPEPNMSSYGSGIKISQYTSCDSDDQLDTDTKISESAASPNDSNASYHNGETYPENIVNEVLPLTIHSPLDFSIIDSSFDNASLGEIKKSPRIFGRYYTDMDQDILEEVQSRGETPRSEPEENDSNHTTKPFSIKHENQLELENNDDSFKNIQLIHSPLQFTVHNNGDSEDSDSDVDVPFSNIQTVKPIPSEEITAIISKPKLEITNKQEPVFSNENEFDRHREATPTMNTSIIPNVPLHQVKRNINQAVEYDHMPKSLEIPKIQTQTIDQQPVVKRNINQVQVEKSDQHMPKSMKVSDSQINAQQPAVLKSILKRKVDDNATNENCKKSANSKEKHTESKKPVNIKVSNLARKDSGRGNVKRGYVHAISALFDKTVNAKTPVQGPKNKPKKVEKKELTPVNRLSPNNNIVLDVKRKTQETIREEHEPCGSLGFEVEVTPLKKVNSFEQLAPKITTQPFEVSPLEKVNSFENLPTEKIIHSSEDQIDKKVEVDNSSSETESDTNLKEYAEQIQDMENEDRDDDTTVEPTVHVSIMLEKQTSVEKPRESSNGGVDLGERISPFNVKPIVPESVGKIISRKPEIHSTKTIPEKLHELPIEIHERSEDTHVLSPKRIINDNGPQVTDPGPVTDTTTTKSKDPSVDMSDFMWRIPWKTRKQREAEKELKPADPEPFKPSGYLRNLISRVDKPEPQATPYEPIVRPKRARYESRVQEKTRLASPERLSNGAHGIVPGVRPRMHRNNRDSHFMEEKNHTKPVYGPQESGNLTIVPEFQPSLHDNRRKHKVIEDADEFRPVRSPEESRSSKTDTNADFSHRFENDWNMSTAFDDPQFDVRYPSSLSRRLYGPYCRLRGINNDEEQNDSDDERETTREDLSPIQIEDRQSYPKVRKPLNSFTTPLVNKDISNEHEMTDRQLFNPVDKNISLNNKFGFDKQTKCTPPSSPVCSDRETNGYISTTQPVVHTPLTTHFSQGGLNFNTTKPITDDEINRASRSFKKSENNFVSVTLPFVKPQPYLSDEARRDKQNFKFPKSTYYGNASGVKSDCDIENTIKSPDKLNRDSKIVDSNIENSRKNERSDKTNASDKMGVGTNMVTVKNGFNQPGLGVHIPTDEKCNETKPQYVNMNNDQLSFEGKLPSEKTNLPGINYMCSPRETYNTYPHQLMSSGHEAGVDNRLKNGVDDERMPEGNGTEDRTSVLLQSSGYEHVLEDEKGQLRIWPYSDFDNSDRLPVTLHRARRGVNIPVSEGMSNRSGSMTVIQSAERSTEMPENRMVQKYHTSSVVPADRTSGEIMRAHGESVQSVLLQDSNGNNVSEEELAAMLPKIAESISKMENTDAEEILPGITQSITKLKNGGNLVITTMTRKLDEEESGSSGRGSPEPEHPVLNVDDLENSKIFLVQDSKGELFYVEDVTSETQESAYFSSRNNSSSISEAGNSPTFDRISKIQSIGRSGINDSTAQEILGNMYGDSDIKEITENEEEWSERTYEYDIPKKNAYSKDQFKTSYMVEEPGDTMPRMKSATTGEKFESSYQMTGGSPWVYDGGMSQSYSQVTQGVIADDANMSVVSTQHFVPPPPVTTIERYTIEGEAIDYPIVPVAPSPMFLPPPPMVVQTDTPQYSLVKVDVAPKQKTERALAKIEAPPRPVTPVERPIYKTVATIHTPDKLPAPIPPPRERKKYKIIASKATEREEEQESHMRFDEIDYKYTAENVEYQMRPATTETQYFVRNSTKLEAPTSFRSEKRVELNKQSDQKYKSEIQVKETKPEVYEQSSYSYDQMRSELQQSESNMRVVRGSYLIKNSLDGVDGELDDNINMFDGKFAMCKDNPLYKSDEDIYLKLEREKQEETRRQEKFRQSLNPDITYETVDRFSKTKTVKREPETKLSLYELLMQRISTIDTKHIRQNIDVKHSHEDIYGDPRFLQADGRFLQNYEETNDFDTVVDKVDLMIKDGKAFITIKVTAERITPVDLEFNVWRKNQAVVTRTIEVDLLATEKRRRLYYSVMDSPKGGRGYYQNVSNETILDSEQTLDLFTKILGAADGEGDVEDIEVRTRGGRTTRPYPGMDLLY